MPSKKKTCYRLQIKVISHMLDMHTWIHKDLKYMQWNKKEIAREIQRFSLCVWMGMAKKDWERERVGIKGCLGQNVLIPNQHQRELLWDFTLFPFWDEDHCPSVTQQNGSREISCCQEWMICKYDQELRVTGRRERQLSHHIWCRWINDPLIH